MKVQIVDQLLQFVEYDPLELHWLRQKLSWKSEEEGKTFSLLDETSYSYPSTMWGLLSALRKESNVYKLDLINPKDESYVKPYIEPNILTFKDPSHQLHKYQVAAAIKAIMMMIGIIQIPTGGGKTEVMLAILKHLLDNKLIDRALLIVPDIGLGENIIERHSAKNSFPPKTFGMIGGGKNERGRPITVGVINSINSRLAKEDPDIVELVENTPYVAFDECHGLKAPSWYNVATRAKKAKYLHGFSATPFNELNVFENSGDALLQGLCGGVIFQISNKYLVDIGVKAECVVSFKKTPGQGKYFPIGWKKLYERNIVKCKIRNGFIVNDAKLFVKYGFRTAVLVERHEHAHLLMEQLKEFRVVCKFGGDEAIVFDENLQPTKVSMSTTTLVTRFESGDWDILIGSPAMGQGVDIPSIGAIIIAGGNRSRRLVLQRKGRAERKMKVGPNRVYLRDYLDMSHVYLKAQSNKRRALYEEDQSPIIDDEYQFWNMVYYHGQELLDEENRAP